MVPNDVQHVQHVQQTQQSKLVSNAGHLPYGPLRSSDMITKFWVPGIPVPQGDLTASRYGRLYHKNHKELHAWRYEVQWRARKAMKSSKAVALVDVPVSITLRFVLYRPKATAKTRDTPPAIKKPDLDKLARAIGDALTDVVYQDDSQITESHCYKRIAERDESEGVEIMVSAVTEMERWLIQ